MLHIATWVRITPSHPGGAGKSSNALGSSNSFHLPVSWSMEQDMIRIPCRLSCCKAAGQLAFRKQPLESLSHQVLSPSERAQASQASQASRCTMKHIPLVQECSGTHQEHIRNTREWVEANSVPERKTPLAAKTREGTKTSHAPAGKARKSRPRSGPCKTQRLKLSMSLQTAALIFYSIHLRS